MSFRPAKCHLEARGLEPPGPSAAEAAASRPICTAGITGAQRKLYKELVASLRATYSGSLQPGHTTHLVARGDDVEELRASAKCAPAAPSCCCCGRCAVRRPLHAAQLVACLASPAQHIPAPPCRYELAVASGIPVVSIGWLDDSRANGFLLSHLPYTLCVPPAPERRLTAESASTLPAPPVAGAALGKEQARQLLSCAAAPVQTGAAAAGPDPAGQLASAWQPRGHDHSATRAPVQQVASPVSEHPLSVERLRQQSHMAEGQFLTPARSPLAGTVASQPAAAAAGGALVMQGLAAAPGSLASSVLQLAFVTGFPNPTNPQWCRPGAGALTLQAPELHAAATAAARRPPCPSRLPAPTRWVGAPAPAAHVCFEMSVRGVPATLSQVIAVPNLALLQARPTRPPHSATRHSWAGRAPAAAAPFMSTGHLQQAPSCASSTTCTASWQRCRRTVGSSLIGRQRPEPPSDQQGSRRHPPASAQEPAQRWEGW